MCGIYGWQFSTKRGKAVAGTARDVMAAILAVKNNDRGDHSWGAMLLKGDRREVVKDVGSILASQDAVQWGRLSCVMAHTRYGTTGAVTKANSHPFTVKKITLAHNGVVFNHKELLEKHKRKVEVDSEHFAHHLAEDLEFTDIEGYGSLEWSDSSSPHAIFLCRMAGGSLAIAGLGTSEADKQMGVVWSSDKDHLEEALGAAGITYFMYEKPPEGVVLEVSGGRLYETKHRDLVLSERQPSNICQWQGVTSGGKYESYSYGEGGADFSHVGKASWFETREEPFFEDDEVVDFCTRANIREAGSGLYISKKGETLDRTEVEEMMTDEWMKEDDDAEPTQEEMTDFYKRYPEVTKERKHS